MKLKSGLLLLSLCSACTLTVAQPARSVSDPSPTTPAQDYASSSATASSLALTRAEAMKVITDARKYVAHPAKEAHEAIAAPKVITPDFNMDQPPPSPRPETKPEAPAAGYVWVEGHYMPVKGEWRWVKGEWAVPALPISVWIPARYDAKEKRWDPGYWQPDVSPTGAPTEATKEGATKDGKPVTPPNGY